MSEAKTAKDLPACPEDNRKLDIKFTVNYIRDYMQKGA